MSDPRHEDVLVRDAFAELYHRGVQHVRPAGAAAALTRARQRRNHRAVAIAALILLVVAVPTAVFAATGLPGRNHTVAPASPTATANPTGTPTSTPTPSATPTGTASTPPPPTTVTTTLGPGELANAVLPISWHTSGGAETPLCAEGQLRFVQGSATSDVHEPNGQVYRLTQEIITTARADVNGDGVLDVVANVRCDWGEATPKQIIAFTPNGHGGFTALGRVIATGDLVGTDVSELTDLLTFSITAGRIQVGVADSQPCCSTPPSLAVHQTRTYAWTGSAFAQVAGPSSFLVDRSVVKLSIGGPTLKFVAPTKEGSVGHLSIAIRNDGSQPVGPVEIVVKRPVEVGRGTGGDWSRCAPAPANALDGPVCELGTIQPGQTAHLDLQMKAFAPSSADSTGNVEIRVGGLVYTYLPFIASEV